MIVRGRMDKHGLIRINLNSDMTVKMGEQLDLAVIKMRSPRLPNVTNNRLWFKWELREYIDDETSENTVLHKKSFIPVGHYPSLTELIRYMVAFPKAVHLPASTLRNDIIINISELVHVEASERTTRISTAPGLKRGRELYPDSGVDARLVLHVSADLLQLIQKSSAKKRPGMIWLPFTKTSDSKTFDNLSSSLHEQPLCHLMMEHLGEAMIDGRSKPLLFSFPQHRTVHQPHLPRFVPLKSLCRMGSRADVSQLLLWLEDQKGDKIVVDGIFSIELLWRRWTHGSNSH